MRVKKLILSLLGVAGFCFAEKAIELVNPGFEEQDKGWSNTKMCSFIPAAAHSGKYGLRIEDKSDGGSDLRSSAIPVTEGKMYLSRFWFRDLSGESGIAIYHTYYYKNNSMINTNKKQNEILLSLPHDKNWTHIEFPSRAPKGAAYLRFWLHSFNHDSALVDFDDFELVEVAKNEEKKVEKLVARDKNGFPELKPARIAEIAAWLPEKPAGAGLPASQRVAWDALANTPDAKAVIRKAEAYAKEPIPEVLDELYLQYTQNGNRTNYQEPYFKRTTMLEAFALAECYENKGRFIPHVEKMIDAIVKERSWVMPAHDPGLTNFNGTALYGDLGACHRAEDLAHVDWFLQDKIKPELRQAIRREFKRRILDTYLSIIRDGKIVAGQWWTISSNNWNAVCTNCVVTASMVFLEDRNERAEILAAAEESVKYFYKGFTSDGYCSEGVSYWSYGFGNFLKLAETVFDVTGGKMNIYEDDQVVRKACEYARNIMIDDGLAPAYADCGVGARPDVNSLYIIQHRYPDAVLKRVEKPRFLSSMSFISILGFKDYSKLDAAVPEQPVWPLRSYFDEAGILICRDNDAKKGHFGAAIKGGHNAEFHNHNDVGSYVIAFNGAGYVIDPGGEEYTKRTFSQERYVSNVLNSFGHNVPVVAGKLQSTGRAAKGVISGENFTDESDTIYIDMKSCYNVPELQKLTRKFTFDRKNRVVIVQDEVKFSSPQSFVDAIVTASSNLKRSDACVDFYNEKGAIQAEIDVKGAGWKLVPEHISNPGRVSPDRFGIVLDKPVTEAVVTVKYSVIPKSADMDDVYLEADLTGIKFDDAKAIVIPVDTLAKEEGGKVVFEKKYASDGLAFKNWNASGHALTWEVDVPESGKYAIQVKEASGLSDSPLRTVFVDGKQIADKPFYFPPTGGWANEKDEWKVLYLSQKKKVSVVDIGKGKHTIKFVNVNDRAMNFNWIKIVPVK